MIHACISASAIVLMSAICSGAIACNPEGLAKNFASQKEVEELKWKEFVIEEQCVVLRVNASDPSALEKLKLHFKKGHEGNSTAQGTIDGCSAEQIVEAAC
jgi:hypothetical protein